MELGLKGKVAAITGGTQGIGRASARQFAREGAKVAICSRRADKVQETAQELEALGTEALGIAADVSTSEGVEQFIGAVIKHFGRLDILVNNAAVFVRTPLAETTPAQWEHLMGVNLGGAFFCSQAAARAMGRRGGRIINIADVGAVRAWPAYIPYSVSKAGLVMLTRGLAAALAPRIQVNAVGPGVVLLPEGFPKASRKRLSARIPMGRHGDPDDVAAAVCFFATCPDYITGQVLFVDGGATAM